MPRRGYLRFLSLVQDEDVADPDDAYYFNGYFNGSIDL